jgi:hypothetical protein
MNGTLVVSDKWPFLDPTGDTGDPASWQKNAAPSQQNLAGDHCLTAPHRRS